jgi:hypothetical protein
MIADLCRFCKAAGAETQIALTGIKKSASPATGAVALRISMHQPAAQAAPWYGGITMKFMLKFDIKPGVRGRDEAMPDFARPAVNRPRGRRCSAAGRRRTSAAASC